MTKVKLCGMTRPEDIEVCNALLPDYVGFVFWPESRRYISLQRAESLSRSLDRRITPVGVFLDEPLETVLRVAESGTIGMIQLHGSETQEYIKTVKEETGLPVIRALKVTSEKDITVPGMCDYVMFDSGAGTGRTFDWSLLGEAGKRCFLAGGLNPDNVAGAIREVHPYAVDTSSGIETDGVKDPVKMKKFMEAVRMADSDIGEERI